MCDTMSINQTSLEDHFRRKHPRSPPPKVQPVATSSPIPEDELESEQVEMSQEDQPKTQPDQPTPAIQANICPVCGPTGKYICDLYKNIIWYIGKFQVTL